MFAKKTVERLSLYRRLLLTLFKNGERNFFSHELARMANSTPAMVRRDFMYIGYKGSTKTGYSIESILFCLDKLFDDKGPIDIVIVGLGNIGRALSVYFSREKSKFRVVAGFDEYPNIEHAKSKFPCYKLCELSKVARDNEVKIAVIAVPEEDAQDVANLLVENNITNLLNFAPVPLKVKQHVEVENIDINMLMEKLMYLGNLSNRTESEKYGRNSEKNIRPEKDKRGVIL